MVDVYQDFVIHFVEFIMLLQLIYTSATSEYDNSCEFGRSIDWLLEWFIFNSASRVLRRARVFGTNIVPLVLWYWYSIYLELAIRNNTVFLDLTQTPSLYDDIVADVSVDTQFHSPAYGRPHVRVMSCYRNSVTYRYRQVDHFST